MASKAVHASPSKTTAVAVRRRAARPATPPVAPPPEIVVEPLETVAISTADINGLVMELTALHVQMQEDGHDLIGLLRKAAKDSFGLDLPARPIEMVEDADYEVVED